MPFYNIMDRSPEDILREEQEEDGATRAQRQAEDHLGYEAAAQWDAEQAQQEANHQRDVERDKEMVTEDPGRPPGLGLPHYPEAEYGIEGILNYSYWNQNGAVAIVAKEGGAADWAAYIGGPSPLVRSEEDTVRWVCQKGAKLSREQAHRWFPQLPIEAYRE
jgi:hypothetical protein